MLVVDPERRFTIDQCLNHPWITQSMPGVNDSTGGLVGGIAGLDVNRRGITRERTLLSSINTVQVATRIPGGEKGVPVSVFAKNQHKNLVNTGNREVEPAHERDAGEFMEMGGRGDQPLYSADDHNSIYPVADIASSKKN
jgi:serine/threonine-protein kinase Chk2